LNTIINSVHKPFIASFDAAEWGNCEAEQKKEFATTFNELADEFRDALKSLSTNFTLEPFDRQYEADARNIHTARTINANMIIEFERIFNDWSEQIH